MKKKLIFYNTHPIQYFAPLYKEINDDQFFDLEVWFGCKHGLKGEIDQQFGTNVKWDVPILEGYKYKFLKNYSWRPGLYKGFFGLINLGIWTELKLLPSKSIIVIHGWRPFSALFAICCSKMLGMVTCLRAESPIVHESGKSIPILFLRKIFLKYFLFKIVDKFLYIGTQNKSFFELYGVSESKLIFSPYAVNNKYFRQEAQNLLPKKNELRDNLNIPKDHKVIVFCGKYIDKKRPLDLLEAYLRLPSNKKTTLIFIGEGKLREKLEEEVYSKEIRNVVLTGFINQSVISNYYALADIFVMCSDYGETWGLSTNEAMNFGLPILISDKTGNFSDLVKDNGYVFETGNIDDLSQKLYQILSSSADETLAWSKNSLQIIEKFSYENIIKGLKYISI